MAEQKINGLPVNFGFATKDGIAISLGTGVNATPFTGLLLQSADSGIQADKEEIRQGTGSLAIRSWYDFRGVCTLECVIKADDTITNAVKNTTSSPWAPGNFITITSSANSPDLAGIHAGDDAKFSGAVGSLNAAASIWEIVEGARIRQSNTGSARITIPIEYRPNIQARAAA